MLPKLVVVVNGQSMLEYDREKKLPERQGEFLERMDREMQEGIRISGNLIRNPGVLERAQFVSINLIEAIKGEDEARAAACCSYLASRLPDLKQVKCEDSAGKQTISLVFDREYSPEVKVDFSGADLKLD